MLASHVIQRDCKGPQSMAKCAKNDKVNGGAGSIAEQLVATRADISLGGGKQYFDQIVQAGQGKGQSVLDRAKADGYQVVTDANGLAHVNPNSPVLGTFAKNNMDLEYVGPTPTREGTAPSRCAINTARTASQPHLQDMAAKALSILDTQTKSSDKGFFLQIEGASIDKQDHAANPCGQIGETIQFDYAVRKALDYQKSHPDTLVVVTADHGHTSQIVEGPTQGYTATLRTNEGGDLTIAYATAEARWLAAAHRHRGAHRGRRPAGGQRARRHQPDRPVLHHAPRPRARRLTAGHQHHRVTRAGSSHEGPARSRPRPCRDASTGSPRRRRVNRYSHLGGRGSGAAAQGAQRRGGLAGLALGPPQGPDGGVAGPGRRGALLAGEPQAARSGRRRAARRPWRPAPRRPPPPSPGPRRPRHRWRPARPARAARPAGRALGRPAARARDVPRASPVPAPERAPARPSASVPARAAAARWPR
ncbi:hypothetical protein GCM10025868_19800 [Angustibacter aerolatus]|uniref:Alkaline phosphatase n=1 Tax=Angustibacter aerolatus TaxID=1162965 RepID=A0ABQ6JEX7_9ACTN|nr:hypothetical protein GCM10025868_19800 [Angustibacter aerolatus]